MSLSTRHKETGMDKQLRIKSHIQPKVHSKGESARAEVRTQHRKEARLFPEVTPPVHSVTTAVP